MKDDSKHSYDSPYDDWRAEGILNGWIEPGFVSMGYHHYLQITDDRVDDAPSKPARRTHRDDPELGDLLHFMEDQFDELNAPSMFVLTGRDIAFAAMKAEEEDDEWYEDDDD